MATGGKTDYCDQPGRNVTTDRFHTSATFDFAEAKQDAPYARHRHAYRDILGLYKEPHAADDPEAVTDVTALRQVFGLRGEGLWISCDRIQSPRDKDHEYTQFYTLPVRLEESGLADRVRLLTAPETPLVEVDPVEGRIRTAHPGFENASLYCFGPAELKFANVLNANGEHDVLKKSPLENIQTALKAGKSPEVFLKQPIQYPISVRFHGKGNQVFVVAICTRRADLDLAKPFANDVREIQKLSGEGGVTGCRVVTRSGSQAWFQSGSKPLNRLACGPVAYAVQLRRLPRRFGAETFGPGRCVVGCGGVGEESQHRTRFCRSLRGLRKRSHQRRLYVPRAGAPLHANHGRRLRFANIRRWPGVVPEPNAARGERMVCRPSDGPAPSAGDLHRLSREEVPKRVLDGLAGRGNVAGRTCAGNLRAGLRETAAAIHLVAAIVDGPMDPDRRT